MNSNIISPYVDEDYHVGLEEHPISLKYLNLGVDPGPRYKTVNVNLLPPCTTKHVLS